MICVDNITRAPFADYTKRYANKPNWFLTIQCFQTRFINFYSEVTLFMFHLCIQY